MTENSPEEFDYVIVGAGRQPNDLSDAMDWRVTLGGLRLLRRLLGTPELKAFAEQETLPGPDVQSDDELLGFAYQNGSTAYHLIGAARMGPGTDPGAVVGDQLRVHGLQGLRIANASIMPTMPSANTYATTLMIAEMASRHDPRSSERACGGAGGLNAMAEGRGSRLIFAVGTVEALWTSGTG